MSLKKTEMNRMLCQNGIGPAQAELAALMVFAQKKTDPYAFEWIEKVDRRH